MQNWKMISTKISPFPSSFAPQGALQHKTTACCLCSDLGGALTFFCLKGTNIIMFTLIQSQMSLLSMLSKEKLLSVCDSHILIDSAVAELNGYLLLTTDGGGIFCGVSFSFTASDKFGNAGLVSIFFRSRLGIPTWGKNCMWLKKQKVNTITDSLGL